MSRPVNLKLPAPKKLDKPLADKRHISVPNPYQTIVRALLARPRKA